jgi:hypothetical protein
VAEKAKRTVKRTCPSCGGDGMIASNVDGVQGCHCGDGTIEVEITGPEYRVGDRVMVSFEPGILGQSGLRWERGTVVECGYCAPDQVTVRLPGDPDWRGPCSYDFTRVRLVKRALEKKPK